MTRRAKKLYDSAIKNEIFLNAIYDADGDKKPSFFASEQEKSFFSAVYYGWMVSRYGKEWESFL